MVAPLVIGLAAGALGFVLGGLGKQKEPPQKEEPAPPPPPDPRIDQIMQSQQRQEALLNQLMGQGQQQPYGILQNPAALNAYLGSSCTPGQFNIMLDNLLSRLPAPCGGAKMFFVAGARCS